MMMPWLLVILGTIFLLENLGFIPWLDWSSIWPVILILAGLFMMKKKCGDSRRGFMGGKKEEEKK